MKSLHIRSFAKINLCLNVVKKRDDGFHELDMVMLPIELHDSLQVSVLYNSYDSYVTCDHIELKEAKYNLINKTIAEMKKRYGIKQNFNVVVHKEIPICAGLGGGSSNAAATIKAIEHLAKLKLSPDEELDLGRSLGADVPFCLTNKAARVQGIGEYIRPISLKKRYHVLIIKPEEGLSTKHVFDVADKMDLPHGDADAVENALIEGNDEALAKSMFNALETASFTLVDEISKVKNMLKNDGFEMTLMSGSGSAVFALTTDLKKAQACYKKYEKEGYDVYLTRTLS